MKKSALSLAILISTFSSAQLLNFGVKGGANVSNLINEGIANIEEKSTTVDYYAGIFLNIPLGKISLQPEILYNKVGQKFEYKKLPNTLFVKNDLDYISIPVMVQYKLGGGLYIEGGPQFSYLINHKNEVSGFDNDTPKPKAVNIIDDIFPKDKYKDFDLGIGLGAGYKIYKNIGVNARYVMGVSNNAKDNNETLKNSAFQVGATVGF